MMTRLLRWTGAITLMAALAVFMLQGVETLTSLDKYIALMGVSFTLMLAGYFSAKNLREDKGARTFFGLAAVSVIAIFSQLGAFIYARVGEASAKLPTLLLYQLPEEIGLVPVIVGSIVLTFPMAYLGISALHRSKGVAYAVLYFLSCGLFLIPVREVQFMMGVLCAAGVFLIYMDRALSKDDLHLQSFDGGLLRTLIFAPIAVLIVREGFYVSHSGDDLAIYVTGLTFFAGLVFFQLIPRLIENHKLAALPQAIGALLFCGAWTGAASYFGLGNTKEEFILVGLGYPVILFGLSFVARTPGNIYRISGAWVFVWMATFQVFGAGGLVISLVYLVLALVMVVLAFLLREKHPMFLGIGIIGVNVIYQLKGVLVFYENSPWFALAVTGVGVILLSSFLEKNLPAWSKAYGGLTKEIGEWK